MHFFKSCSDCGRIAEGHRCDDCQAKRPKRKTHRERGYTAAWDRLSRDYRDLFPTCEEDGCDSPSACVDHIDGLGPNGPKGFDTDNLQALCWSHHSRKTAEQSPGGWNAR